MTTVEEDAIHLFALRLSRSLSSLACPDEVRNDLWQAFYTAIRTDLERYERERGA